MEEAIESWPKKEWDIPKVTQILANLEYGPLFLSPNTIFMLLNYYFTRIKELDYPRTNACASTFHINFLGMLPKHTPLVN